MQQNKMIGFTDITSNKPSFRYYGKGFVYDVSGPSMFNSSVGEIYEDGSGIRQHTGRQAHLWCGG